MESVIRGSDSMVMLVGSEHFWGPRCDWCTVDGSAAAALRRCFGGGRLDWRVSPRSRRVWLIRLEQVTLVAGECNTPRIARARGGCCIRELYLS